MRPCRAAKRCLWLGPAGYCRRGGGAVANTHAHTHTYAFVSAIFHRELRWSHSAGPASGLAGHQYHNPDNIFWVTSNSGTPTPPADSLPNAAFVNDPALRSDKELDSPTVAYGDGAQLVFRQNYDLEQSSSTVAFDNGLLEISINGGAFNDIVLAGGGFVTGGYDHTSISTGFQNPCSQQYGGTKPNWSGISNGGAGGFQTVQVNLPASGVGQPVKFRWRMCSDTSVTHAGWRVDNVSIAETTCPTPTPHLRRHPHRLQHRLRHLHRHRGRSRCTRVVTKCTACKGWTSSGMGPPLLTSTSIATAC